MQNRTPAAVAIILLIAVLGIGCQSQPDAVDGPIAAPPLVGLHAPLDRIIDCQLRAASLSDVVEHVRRQTGATVDLDGFDDDPFWIDMTMRRASGRAVLDAALTQYHALWGSGRGRPEYAIHETSDGATIGPAFAERPMMMRHYALGPVIDRWVDRQMAAPPPPEAQRSELFTPPDRASLAQQLRGELRNHLTLFTPLRYRDPSDERFRSWWIGNVLTVNAPPWLHERVETELRLLRRAVMRPPNVDTVADVSPSRERVLRALRVAWTPPAQGVSIKELAQVLRDQTGLVVVVLDEQTMDFVDLEQKVQPPSDVRTFEQMLDWLRRVQEHSDVSRPWYWRVDQLGKVWLGGQDAVRARDLRTAAYDLTGICAAADAPELHLPDHLYSVVRETLRAVDGDTRNPGRYAPLYANAEWVYPYLLVQTTDRHHRALSTVIESLRDAMELDAGATDTQR